MYIHLPSHFVLYLNFQVFLTDATFKDSPSYLIMVCLILYFFLEDVRASGVGCVSSFHWSILV